MSPKRYKLPEDIFKHNPKRDEHISQVIRQMLKSPELRELADEEKEYILGLIRSLDQKGLIELRGMIDDRLSQFEN